MHFGVKSLFLQCSSKISELLIHVPYADMLSYVFKICAHMCMSSSFMLLLFIAIPLLFVALCGMAREMVK